MAKQLDPVIVTILKEHGFGPEAAWDCHGTWVVYHRVLEQIAAKANINFEPPQVLEANGTAKSVALCVTGNLDKRSEWSVGEASPANNKNSYPYAMAEKRAKDRVILKLIGLHGLAYSEEEADDFKDSTPKAEPKPTPPPKTLADGLNAAHEKAKAWATASIASIGRMTAKELSVWETANQSHIVRLRGIDADLHARVLKAMQDCDGLKQAAE